MDQQAKDRIEGWLRDVDRKLGEAEARLATVMGALDEDGVALRRAHWVEGRIKEAREDYTGFAVHVQTELAQAVADFERSEPVLTAGAGI